MFIKKIMIILAQLLKQQEVFEKIVIQLFAII